MISFLQEEDLWVLSITVTGRCNCDCSYCHFYDRRDRKEYMRDIEDELYEKYIDLINEIKNNVHKNIQVRFSGGEPLIIGDRLFELSSKLYNKTGIKPYVLTNGRLLNKDVVEKAKENYIQAFLVSIENPLDEAEGAPKTKETLKVIRDLDSKEVRVTPAIMIVKNNMFKNLSQIADYIYNEIGVLPSFAELTYQAYERPTDEEFKELYFNVREICKKYYGKTSIRIFPYVSPEYYANGQRNYLTELDIDNLIGITSSNIKQVVENMFKKLEKSYRENPCSKSECEWYEDCRILKWIWVCPTQNASVEEKLIDYCKFKNTINNAMYDGIIGNNV